MKVASQQINVRNLYSGRSPFANLQEAVENTLGTDTTPLRLSVTGRSRQEHHCEVEAVFPRVCGPSGADTSIFDFRPRRHGRTDKFNAVMLIPTGVDCAIGGHAGVWSLRYLGALFASERGYHACLRRSFATATHEAAHVLGLDHCEDALCNLNGSTCGGAAGCQPLHLCPLCLRKLCWNRQVDLLPYLRRLRALAARLEKPGSSGSAVLAGLRFLLLGLLCFVIIKYFGVGAVPVFAGLLVSVAAVLIELVYELIFTR